MEPALLYITAATREEAISLSRELLSERLIACANIIEPMLSMYHWQGEIEHSTEAVIIAKTLRSHVDRVTERVKELHSYATPCVLVLEASAGNRDYVEWMRGELRG